MICGLLTDPIYLDHDPGPNHPECSARLSTTLSYLKDLDWFADLQPIQARAAERRWIATIHSDAYITRAASACRAGEHCLDSPDVGICSASFEIATYATGGALALADSLIDGAIDNGFALLRPPGHHAEHDRALGFCLFNNIAILTRYLQQEYGMDKIAIIDFDVHHGNGTQHSFADDPSVLYVSTHQYPYYPGTGARSETGTGRGRGTTLNCPMREGATDNDYQSVFTHIIIPAVSAFKPEIVLLSAGFDAHQDDPLAGIQLSTAGFTWISERCMELADSCAGGRLISLLEGGYNLHALPRCVAAHLAILSGGSAP